MCLLTMCWFEKQFSLPRFSLCFWLTSHFYTRWKTFLLEDYQLNIFLEKYNVAFCTYFSNSNIDYHCSIFWEWTGMCVHESSLLFSFVMLPWLLIPMTQSYTRLHRLGIQNQTRLLLLQILATNLRVPRWTSFWSASYKFGTTHYFFRFCNSVEQLSELRKGPYYNFITAKRYKSNQPKEETR